MSVKKTVKATTTPVGFSHNMMDLADKKAAVRVLMQKQNEDAGHKVLAFANEVPNTYEIRRPSGLIQLDIDTGGGLPAGTMCEISGPQGAGKSMLAMQYCRMHQKLYGEQAFLAYACTESPFDYRRAMNIGLKVSVPDEIIAQWNKEKLERNLPAYTDEDVGYFKEKQGEFVIIRGNTGEEILQATLDSVRSGLFGIIIIDSVSVLLPDADADKDMDENNKMAANASLITNFVKKVNPAFNGLDGLNYTTLISINQVRSNQARANAQAHIQKYLKEWASTGAYAARHAKHIDITVWSGGKIKKTIKSVEHVVGKSVNYEISKGKTGAHENVVNEFNFYYDNYLPAGIDHLQDLITAGQSAGVIVEKGGKVTLIQPESGAATIYKDIPGFPTFKKMMEADFEFELTVRREVLAASGKMCLYR